MGLERLAAVLQHVHRTTRSTCSSDLIAAAAKLTGATDLAIAVAARRSPITSAPARSSIVDGVIPGNEGRGYVLRRIIRRAIRHGYQLGQTQPFFHKLVPELVDARWAMRIPELAAKQDARRRRC